MSPPLHVSPLGPSQSNDPFPRQQVQRERVNALPGVEGQRLRVQGQEKGVEQAGWVRAVEGVSHQQCDGEMRVCGKEN